MKSSETTNSQLRNSLGRIARTTALTVSIVVAVAVPSISQALHGCANATNGQLRLLLPPETECKNSEAPVNWNIQGIQGPQGVQGQQGIQGIQGVQGATGAAAVSRVFTFATDLNGRLPQSSGDDVAPIASLSLPAGRYYVTARVQVSVGVNQGFSSYYVPCDLRTPPFGILDRSHILAFTRESQGGFGDVITLAAPANLNNAGSIQLRCVEWLPGPPIVGRELRITAFQVDDIVNQ